MKLKSVHEAISRAIGNIQEGLGRVTMDYETASKVTEELRIIELVLDELWEAKDRE